MENNDRELHSPIEIPRDVYEELNMIAESEGKDFMEIVIEALEEYLGNRIYG